MRHVYVTLITLEAAAALIAYQINAIKLNLYEISETNYLNLIYATAQTLAKVMAKDESYYCQFYKVFLKILLWMGWQIIHI